MRLAADATPAAEGRMWRGQRSKGQTAEGVSDGRNAVESFGLTNTTSCKLQAKERQQVQPVTPLRRDAARPCLSPGSSEKHLQTPHV